MRARIPLMALMTLLFPAALRAELVFSQTALDLGGVRAGQLLEHRVPLVNSGSAAAEVIEVKPGCGCIKADVDPRVVPPAQRANLVMRINTLSLSAGPQAWRVQVRYKSGGVERDTTLVVKANIYQEILVQPPSILIYSDKATRHELAVTDLRVKPLRIVKLEPSSPQLKAVLGEEVRTPDGCLVRKITLDVGSGFTPGRHEETLTIHTDDDLYRQLQVSVSVVKKVRQRFTALPPSVSLVVSVSQPTATRLVTLRDSQGKPLEIERVAADDPAIACQWSEGSNAVATLKLTIDRAKMLGDELDSRVHVLFKNGDGEKLTIPVKCSAR